MRVYKQGMAPTCGPRSIQTVLAYYGLHPNYREVRRICETDSVGTDLVKINKAAEHFGLITEVYTEDNVSIDVITSNLDKGNLVMVHWYTGIGNTTHVATAYNYDTVYIYLADTAAHLYTEPYIAIRKSMLEKCWKIHPDVRWLLAMYR